MVTGALYSQQLLFQRLVREIRKEAGLTQSELANQLNKPQSYVSKYESGERRLDVIELYEVCAACGVQLEVFGRRLGEGLKKFRGLN